MSAAVATAAVAGRNASRAAERSALCKSCAILARSVKAYSTHSSTLSPIGDGSAFFLHLRPLCSTPAFRSAGGLSLRSYSRKDHSECLPRTEDLPPKARLVIRRASKQEPRIHTQENSSGRTELWVEARPERNVSANDLANNSDGAVTGDEFMLDWIDPPQTVLLVKKHDDDAAKKTLVEIARYLKNEWPHLNVVVESSLGYMFQEIPFARFVPEEEKDELARIVDFVVAIGGDGTMLRVSGLFDKEVPPIISFSLGRLGFLMPYDRRKYREALARMMRGDVTILMRMRLSCSLWSGNGKKILRDGRGMASINIMNEIVIHRGQSPHLAVVDVFVNSQLLTEAMGDGLIVATPTGSTAYSLSAGGPIVHPSLPAMVLTPICPQSLSFRPAILPGRSKVQLRISTAARGPAQISFDGRQVSLLNVGEAVEVGLSQYPVPCANRVDQSADWVRDLNDMLKWNQSFVGGGSTKFLVQPDVSTTSSTADSNEGLRSFGVSRKSDA